MGQPGPGRPHPVWLVVGLTHPPLGSGQSSFLPAELWQGLDRAPPGSRKTSSCELTHRKKVERDYCTHSADGVREAGGLS